MQKKPKYNTRGKTPVVTENPPEQPPQPTWLGTLALMVGLMITAATMNGKMASGFARYAAYGTGISIAASIGFDMLKGVRNLIRADLMAIVALYFLTLFEFLYPQENFDAMVPLQLVRPGLEAVLWGMAGLGLGRHLLNYKQEAFAEVFVRPVSAKLIMTVFWFALIVGYMHQFVAVDFDPFQVVEYYIAPRFTQPWGRGKLGDWKALFVELGMLIYLIPPLAGVVLAKRKSYSNAQLIVVSLGLTWTLLFGFVGGTRNVFASFLVTFMIAYNFSIGAKRTKELLLVSAVCVVAMLYATHQMLAFRDVGFKNYINGVVEKKEDTEKTLFVDYNLYVICGLVQVFPDRHPYLGWEIPYLALIRPVPRAIWRDKPEGMSAAIEQVLGVEGLTLAASFVGEAYVADGNVGVFLAGLFFGAMAGWWSHLASPKNSDFGVLIYASGFFAAVISMRSLFVFTTAILPTLVAIIGGSFLIKKVSESKVINMPLYMGGRGPHRP